MDTKISEEDLLSGVELLPTTEPNTPNNLQTSARKLEDTNVSILSANSSPMKSFQLLSPTKTHPGVQSFSDTAIQVQKRLHDSLAYSLRKEVEIKASWQASPGEICKRDFRQSVNKLDKKPEAFVRKSESSGVCENPTSVSVLSKSKFLSLPPTDSSSHQEPKNCGENEKIGSSEVLFPHRGPNVCLSDQFPSGISPIKTCEHEDKKASSLRNISDKNQAFGEDPNTQKLLEFIQKLEKGSNSDGTLADRLNQLSFLLKNSSMNMDAEDEPSRDKLDSGSIQKSVKALAESCRPQAENFSVVSKPSILSNQATNQKSKVSSKQPLHKNTTMKKVVQIKDPVAASHQGKSGKLHSAISSQHINSKNAQGGKQENGNRQHKAKKSTKHKVAKELGSDSHPADKAHIHPTGQSNHNDSSKPPSLVVQEMDKVRDHLHTMLNLHKIDPLSLDLSASHTNHDSKDEDTFRSNDTATLLRAQASELIPSSPHKDPSADLTDSLTTGLFSILKTGHNNQPTSGRSSIDSSLTAENGMLRDTLEKETYRRKHCEKQIQKLQKKMLDVQQELAVAHSTDRKKDLMIEQLDKTLAKVVEGWKVHEANLVKSVEQLTREKETYKVENVKLKEMLVSLENELAKVLEELVDEKEHILRLEEKEKMMQISYQSRAEEISKVIDQKNEKMSQLQQKNDALLEERKLLQQTVDDIAQDSKDQKNSFMEKEARWDEAVVEIEKRQKELLQNEKALTEQERRRCSNIQASLASTDQEVTRLKDLLEAQRSEMESMRTQAAITETKHQGDLRKMEAEHKINIERQIMEKLSQVHEESQNNESRIREAHKKQVLELMEGHKRELECQCRRYEDELQKRDETLRKAINEHEISANEKLKLKSEGMRQQMLNKMQNLLQTHYNETLQVVGNTAGVTPPRVPITSKQTNLSLSHETSLIPSTARNSRSLVGQQESIASYRQNHLMGQPPSGFTSMPPQSKPVIVKPTPTLPLMDQPPSAFALSTSGALVSSFQPVSSGAPGRTHSLVSLQAQESYNREQPAVPNTSVAENLEIEEEALPNLSLLSSISHSTATSMQRHEYHPSRATAGIITRTFPDGHSNMTGAHAAQQIKSVEEIPNEGYPVKQDEGVIRQSQLQHYVQMLLQRSPGAPLDASPSASLVESKEDNKENFGQSVAIPVMSYPQLVSQPTVFTHVTNQHSEASPDLVPVKQVVPGSIPGQAGKPQAVPISRFSVPTKPVVTDAKRTKSNVRFADDPSALLPSSNTPSEPSTFLNPTQVSEISRMLGLYSTSDTPSGETKLAAEQLLSYLRLNNSTSAVPVSKSSIQPSVTSSPMKKNAKQVERVHDVSLVHPTGKTLRMKTGISPSKPAPAWR